MPIKMRRKKLPPTGWHNPSLFFDKGFEEWVVDNGKRGEHIGDHLKTVCEISASKDCQEIYKAAYHRWLGETEDKEQFAHWFGQLDGTRLFIGLGMAHVLEAQVCRHPVYGLPYIPGSALKGLARAKAKEYAKEAKFGMNDKVINVLFGPDLNDSKEDNPKANTGYLIFHDAWWIPQGQKGGSQDRPYVQEIVTVHAVKYYKKQGEKAPHPDLESPNPNHQIAVQGSFYFTVEGKQQWSALGMKFLSLALEAEGIGGKTAAGYGYFAEDEEDRKRKQKEFEEKQKAKQAKIDQKKAEEKAKIEAEKIKAETERFNNLPEAERFVCQLDEKIVEYLKNNTISGKSGQDAIISWVNKIIKSKGWSRSEKDMGFHIVNCACLLVLRGKTLQKKKTKAKEWLKAEE
ncbi:MAG: type III-B CRISPR module RAMP protein Cmr6 [Candidatus Electrothrix sp. AR3]|nr:type III-B CRISPR module RAMP protein Cmr6 [Candidatus Electrothrix sp. AR3]